MAVVDYRHWFALDSCHGRVLIHANANTMEPSKGLIVSDAITSSQQHLIAPSYYFCNYMGAVLCAKDSCDHLDYHGGPFRVVIIVETNCIRTVFAFASIYSSVTGAWNALTSIESSYFGDKLYFPIENDTIILKYDLCTHWLSQIDMPRDLSNKAILMKAEDRGLGFATLRNNHFYLWSQQDVADGIGGWVEHRVIRLGTLFPRCMPYESYEVVGFAKGTNTIFINIYT
ncbi:hypothetical protein BDA96_02G019100 [Sorghum bicolor]|uniref:Uncharacterized protein n=1 Tax=Sorghum bicolor TaxID=4558 RepID=A0A921USB7_SORBI|nr:hypothetical protein BDA96_02G019100 [Sorghum bicolor]